VLVQFTADKKTRQYDDFQTVAQAMDGICKLFEQRLKQMNPNTRNINYDVKDLYDYVDNLGDLAALVLDPQTNSYVPRNKEWIKQRVFKHLQKMASFGK